jgi:hypothetical protein
MPLCIAEIMCLVIGIVILVTVLTSGGCPMGGTNELRGAPAYISSGLLMAVVPVEFLVIFGVAGFKIHQQGDLDEEDWSMILIELGVLLLFVIPAICVAAFGAQPRKRRKKKKKRRREYDDFEDYDDRPRRRRDDDYDYEGPDERPRRRRQSDDEEPADEPRRRRFDGSESQRRRRRLDKDEDED